ncbi:MAG: hypothetical protein AVDCRST_MAG18-4561 [uncultured Thermomicrobiales bacterium]|uniref:Uncharacterized protein n=1 Tax=uncultured Thermomicrobiales bacterium TaxID=1645740 RepID=A0A6J4VV05_9BACT|nr:MAG: hypothetical protein AVDCRST_MAG18-4561 [uncultured Thermomicrobiales bacterium]
MGAIARRKATGYSHWLTEWKHGQVAGRAEPTRRGEIMVDDVLSTFFARYPSALGSTHAGGQYRIICPECGHIVPVAVLDDETRHLSVRCANCGYADELGDAAAQEVHPAA